MTQTHNKQADNWQARSEENMRKIGEEFWKMTKLHQTQAGEQERDRMILESAPLDQPLNDIEQAALDRELARERTQHTPGPWEHRVNTDSAARFVEIIGEGWAIAHVYGKTNLVETQANARLIAAAPELLAALRELRNELSAGAPITHAKRMRMLDVAVGAIAKAEKGA